MRIHAGCITVSRIGSALSLVPALVMVLGGMVQASDWPAWRGPDGDGISTESAWSHEPLVDGADILWSADVGEGYSSVVVRGARLYTMGNQNNEDIVYCLEAETGREVWSFRYPCKSGSYPGPRATPVLSGDRVFSLSRDGEVICLDSAQGTQQWRRNVLSEIGARNTQWGVASSPYVVDGKVILNAGKAGVALNEATGEVVWSNGAGLGGYATPVALKAAGELSVTVFSAKHLYGVRVEDGAILWTFPWQTKYDVNAADPVVTRDGQIFVSSGYGRGCALVDVSVSPPRPVWEHTKLSNHFSSSVVLGGHLYGMDGNAGRGSLRCLDLTSGAVAWSQDLGFGSLMAAAGKLIILNESGMLFIADALPDAYRERARCQVIEKPKCWTAPVLSGGRIFCRNSLGHLVCVDVRK
jgi:outer membrane protein assembly factor BamB